MHTPLQRNYASALRAAASEFAKNPSMGLSKLTLNVEGLAAAFGLAFPAKLGRIPIKRNDYNEQQIIHCTFALAECPCTNCLRELHRWIAAYKRECIRLHDAATKERLISRSAELPTTMPPNPREIPPGALNWQTSPAISVPQDTIVFFDQFAQKPRRWNPATDEPLGSIASLPKAERKAICRACPKESAYKHFNEPRVTLRSPPVPTMRYGSTHIAQAPMPVRLESLDDSWSPPNRRMEWAKDAMAAARNIGATRSAARADFWRERVIHYANLILAD